MVVSRMGNRKKAKPMASNDEPVSMDVEGDEEENGGGGGFLGRVKGFIHDVGKELEEAITTHRPDSAISAVHTTSVDLHRADLLVDVLVTNPNPVPVPLADLRYLVIDSHGRHLGSCLIPGAGTIFPHGSEIIKVPLILDYDDIMSTHDDVRRGSIIPYRVAMELTADVPIVGKVTLPMEKTGEVPVPYAQEVDLKRVKFYGVSSMGETRATLHLKVGNRNKFDLGLNSAECEERLGGVSVGRMSSRRSALIRRHGSGMVEVPVTFGPTEMGSAVWEMVRGRAAVYAMKGSVDVDTPFGPMKLPFSREAGCTRLTGAEEDDGDEDEDDQG